MDESIVFELADGYLRLAAWLGSGNLPYDLTKRATGLEVGMRNALSVFFAKDVLLDGVDMARIILNGRSRVGDAPIEEASPYSTT